MGLKMYCNLKSPKLCGYTVWVNCWVTCRVNGSRNCNISRYFVSLCDFSQRYFEVFPSMNSYESSNQLYELLACVGLSCMCCWLGLLAWVVPFADGRSDWWHFEKARFTKRKCVQLGRETCRTIERPHVASSGSLTQIAFYWTPVVLGAQDAARAL